MIEHLDPVPQRILVTGSREWSNMTRMEEELQNAYEQLGSWDTTILVHGGAIGADLMAEYIWKRRGLPTEEVPADWERWGKSAGSRRNQEMVNRGADLCVAFPTSESRGTWDCIKRAQAARIETWIIDE